MADYGGYFGLLLKHAARPTGRVFGDLRIDLGLVFAGVVLVWLVRPNGAVVDSVVTTALWVVIGAIGLIVAVFVVNLFLAPPRLYFELEQTLREQDHAAKAEIDQLKINLQIETQRAPNKNARSADLQSAALLLCTELSDIRHKVEIIRSVRPHPQYSDGFQFPAARWDEYDELLAGDPTLYRIVERAYKAAQHTNEVLRMRETRADGVGLGETTDENLNAVYIAAGDAIEALESFVPVKEPESLIATKREGDRNRVERLIRRGRELRAQVLPKDRWKNMTGEELEKDQEALLLVVQWNEQVAVRATLWRSDVMRLLHEIGQGAPELFNDEDDPREQWGAVIDRRLDERLAELGEIAQRLFPLDSKERV